MKAIGTVTKCMTQGNVTLSLSSSLITCRRPSLLLTEMTNYSNMAQCRPLAKVTRLVMTTAKLTHIPRICSKSTSSL